MTWFRLRRSERSERSELPGLLPPPRRASLAELPELPARKWLVFKRNGVWIVRRRIWYHDPSLYRLHGVDCRRYTDRLAFAAPTWEHALRWINHQPKEVNR